MKEKRLKRVARGLWEESETFNDIKANGRILGCITDALQNKWKYKLVSSSWFLWKISFSLMDLGIPSIQMIPQYYIYMCSFILNFYYAFQLPSKILC